jgi:hypothetical protein
MLVVFENKKNALFVVEAVDFESLARTDKTVFSSGPSDYPR